MAKRGDDGWAELAADLRARVAAFAPDWTEPPSRDPGITILEVFEFLGESILTRPEVAEADRQRLREVLARLQRAGDRPCDDAVLTRPTFFVGKLLTAEDLTQEQAYQVGHRRRHNRLLHGVGVVRGLEVGVERGPSGSDVVTVSPGVAISSAGDELVVCERVTLDPCPDPTPCYVTIAIVERPAGVVPVPIEPGEETTERRPDRIEEATEVAVTPDVAAGGLAIGRLQRSGSGAWRVDPSFRPPRVTG